MTRSSFIVVKKEGRCALFGMLSWADPGRAGKLEIFVFSYLQAKKNTLQQEIWL